MSSVDERSPRFDWLPQGHPVSAVSPFGSQGLLTVQPRRFRASCQPIDFAPAPTTVLPTPIARPPSLARSWFWFFTPSFPTTPCPRRTLPEMRHPGALAASSRLPEHRSYSAGLRPPLVDVPRPAASAYALPRTPGADALQRPPTHRTCRHSPTFSHSPHVPALANPVTA